MKHFLEKSKLTIKGAGGGGAPSPPAPVAVQMYPSVLAPPLMGDTSYISSFSYAEIVDLISDGPIEGIVNKDNKKVYGSNIFEGIYLNGVPIKETSRISSEEININFLKQILKNFWRINDEGLGSLALTSANPSQLTVLETDLNLKNNPFFYGPIDIKSFHPDDSLLALVNSLNLNLDSVKLAQRAFNTLLGEEELPFLTIVSIPDSIFPIFSTKFIAEDFNDAEHGLKLDVTNIADYIYFDVNNENLNSNQYAEIPKTFITATKQQTNPTNLKNNLTPLSGYTPIRFTNIKIYIWSIYNKKSGVKNISKTFDKYFNSIFVTQSNRTLYNYNLIKTEFKTGSEIQYPLQNFKNTEIDIEFNKELVGPFKILNNQTVTSAKTTNQGGVSRLENLCCVATKLPVVWDLSRESSDDVRYACRWPVEYDGLGNPLMICDVRFNYAIFDQTSKNRTAQPAIPVTHYIENNNVEEVYVTLNLNTLNDTNHIDLVSAGFGNKAAMTEAPYGGTATYAQLINQTKLTSTSNVPVSTRYIVGVDIANYIKWTEIFPKIPSNLYVDVAIADILKTNIDSIKYPYVAKFALDLSANLLSGKFKNFITKNPVDLIGVNLNYLNSTLKIKDNYISLEILNYLLDKYYRYTSITFENLLSTFESGKLIGYSTIKGNPTRIAGTGLNDAAYNYSSTSNYNIFDAARSNYLNGIYNNQVQYNSVNLTYDIIYKYELISKEVNLQLTALPSRSSSDLTVATLTRPQQITAGTKLPTVVSVKVETGYESNENSNYSNAGEYFAYQYDIYGLAQEPAHIDLGRRSYEFLRGRRIATNPQSLIYNVSNFNGEIVFYFLKLSYSGTDTYAVTNSRNFSYQGICFLNLNQTNLNCELNENGMYGLQTTPSSNLDSSNFMNEFVGSIYPMSTTLSNSIFDQDKLNISCALPELKKLSFLNFSATSSPINSVESSISIDPSINQCYGIDTYKFNNPNNVDLCVQISSFYMKMMDVYSQATKPATTVASYRFFAMTVAGSTSKITTALNKSSFKYIMFKNTVSYISRQYTLILVGLLPTDTTADGSVVTKVLNELKAVTTTITDPDSGSYYIEDDYAFNYRGEVYQEGALFLSYYYQTQDSDNEGYAVGEPYYIHYYHTNVDEQIGSFAKKNTTPLYYSITPYNRSYSNSPTFSNQELVNFATSLSSDESIADLYLLADALKTLTFSYQSNYGKLPQNTVYMEDVEFTLLHEIKVTNLFKINSIPRSSLGLVSIGQSTNTSPPISINAKFWTLFNQGTKMVSVVFADPTKAANWSELEDDLTIKKLPITKLLQNYFDAQNYHFYGQFITTTYSTSNYFVTSAADFYSTNNLNIVKGQVGGKMPSINTYNGNYFKFNPNSFGMVAKSSFGEKFQSKPYNDGGYAYYNYIFKNNTTTPSLDVPSKNLKILTKAKADNETILQVAISLLKSSSLGINAIPTDAFFSSTVASPKVSQTWNNTDNLTISTWGTPLGTRGVGITSTAYVDGNGSQTSTPKTQNLTISYYEVPLSNFDLLQSNNFSTISEQILLPPPKSDASGSPIRRFVKVTKLSYETLSPLINKRISLSKITEIIPQTFSYPFSSIVGMKIDSRSFSQMPTRSFHCKLKKVLVPSNYFPINPKNETDIRYEVSEVGRHKIYDGDWDGTFKLMWTDNPAWILMDILINKRYGLGNYISSEQIDIWELYKVARWCDGVNDEGYYYGVPDGYGGVEPRHAFNALIGDKFNVFDMINQIASIFRGHVYYMNSLVTFDDDRPKPPIGNFSNADVKDGIFNYTNLKKDDEFTAVEIAFIDAKNDYRSSIEYIEDSEGIRKRGILKKQINAFGITSRGQARRFGKHFLHQTSKENLNATFITDIKALLYKPGDLIEINDELLNSSRNFGTIKAIEEVPDSGELFKVVIDKILDTGIYSDQEISLYTALSKAKYDDIKSNTITSDNLTIYSAGPFMKHFERMMKSDNKAIEVLNQDITKLLYDDQKIVNIPLSGELFHPFLAETFCNDLSVLLNTCGALKFGPDPRNFLFYCLTGKKSDIPINLGTGLLIGMNYAIAASPYTFDQNPFDGIKYIATGSCIRCVPNFLPSNFVKNDKYSYTGYMCFSYDAFTTLCTISGRYLKHIITNTSQGIDRICIGPMASSSYGFGCKKIICCIPGTISYLINNTFTNTENLKGHWAFTTGNGNSDYLEIDIVDPTYNKGEIEIDFYIKNTNTGAYFQYSGELNGWPTWCLPVYFDPKKQYYSSSSEPYPVLLKTKTGCFCNTYLFSQILTTSTTETSKHNYLIVSGAFAPSDPSCALHLSKGLMHSDFSQSKLSIINLEKCSKISYCDIIQPHRPSIETFFICDYKTGVGELDQTSDSYCSNQYTELFLSKNNQFGFAKEIFKNGLDVFCIGSPYSLQILNKNAPLFKIMSITENYINEYNILATEYKENKFKEIEENIQIDSLSDTFNALYYYQASSRLTDQIEPLKSPIILSVSKKIYGYFPVLEIIWKPASEHIRSIGGAIGTRYRIYVQSPSKQTPNLQAIVGDEAFNEANDYFKYDYQGDGLINPLETEIGTFTVSIEAFYEKDGTYLFSTPTKRSINLLSY